MSTVSHTLGAGWGWGGAAAPLGKLASQPVGRNGKYLLSLLEQRGRVGTQDCVGHRRGCPGAVEEHRLLHVEAQCLPSGALYLVLTVSPIFTMRITSLLTGCDRLQRQSIWNCGQCLSLARGSQARLASEASCGDSECTPRSAGFVVLCFGLQMGAGDQTRISCL